MILLQKSIEFINIGISFDDLPKSFSIGGFEIAFYGVIIAFAILVGMLVAFAEAKRTGQDVDLYMDFALIIIVSCIIGARAYYVFFKWDYYKHHLAEIINFRQGGLAIYGAVIVAVAGAYIFTKVRKVKFGKLADTAIYGLICGQIIGRYGNFFNREAFGGVAGNKNPFAMRIYFDDYYNIAHVPQSVIENTEKVLGKTATELGYIQVQPTFLYESCWNILVLICMIVFKKHKKFEGEILLWYLGGYGLGRAIVEGLRTDQLIMPYTGWPVSQFLSVVLVVVSVLIIVYKRIKIKKTENVKVAETVDN